VTITQEHTVVSVEITNYQHVGINKPNKNVVYSSVDLAKVYAVIRGMDHVFDQLISVESCPVIESEDRIVRTGELRV
jgi:hypothetical protein